MHKVGLMKKNVIIIKNRLDWNLTCNNYSTKKHHEYLQMCASCEKWVSFGTSFFPWCTTQHFVFTKPLATFDNFLK